MLKAGLLALALSAAVGASAQAAPLFDDYRGFCLKTEANAPAALAAATAAGWMPIPTALMQQLGVGAGIDNADGRMLSSAAGLAFVLVGVKKMPIAGTMLDLRFCAVATTGALATPTEFSTALASWAAIPATPIPGPNGQITYLFFDEGGAHKPMPKPTDVASAKAMIASGHLRLAFVQEGPTLNLLAYAVPSL